MPTITELNPNRPQHRVDAYRWLTALGADTHNAYLSGANLSDANLRNANLSGAKYIQFLYQSGSSENAPLIANMRKNNDGDWYMCVYRGCWGSGTLDEFFQAVLKNPNHGGGSMYHATITFLRSWEAHWIEELESEGE